MTSTAAHKPFTITAVGFLVLVAAVHLVRVFAGWEVQVNGMAVPVWISAPAAVVIAGLAVMVWRESRG